MSAVAVLPVPATLDEDAWDDLLNFVEERRVVPIIGPELLKLDTDAGPRLLYDWVAEKLAAKLGIDLEQLPRPATLNDVVSWYLASHGRREEAYTRVRSVMRDATFAPPRALCQLAQITDFDLYVTTTFDGLLEQAINAERFGGAQSADVVAYAPNRVADLPAGRDRLQRPVVYHLFGRLSASPTYVISDEDTLEFLCALQSEHLTPEKLFHELEHNHLLFIGSSFTNWLARWFLRMAKRHRLSDPRDVGEVLADSHSSADGRLMGFLQQVSVRTRVYAGAEKFVDELHRRWMARHGVGKVLPMASATPRLVPPERDMPERAVFVSYAREDLAAAQALKAGFDAAGVKAWFDLERLEGGDDYDRRIQRNIARCALFVPIVSATTERRHEGYFRREWSYAIDRTRNMADEAVFVLPVCIDDTDAARASVPDKFKSLHFTRLPGGAPTPEFVQRVAGLLASR